MKASRILKNPWVLGMFFLIVLSNIPPVKYVFRLVFDEHHYRYSNQNGSLTYVEFKGHDIDGLYRKINSYKKAFPNTNDTIVYRLYKRNLPCFWRWGEYIYDDRYKIEYKSWKKIKALRGYSLQYSNNWQDF